MTTTAISNAVSDALLGGQTYNTAADILNAIQNGTLSTSGPAINAAMQQVASNGLAPQNTYSAPSSAPASRQVAYSSPNGQSITYTPVNNTALPSGASDVFAFLARNSIDPSVLSDPNSGIYANLKASGYDPSVLSAIQTAFTPAPAPAASSGTPLSNFAAPQFVGTSAPGAVGTTYGQASGDMISAAQQANPALTTALTSGNAAVNYNADTGTYNLIDNTTGTPIAGNYQVQVGPNGTGINIPSGNGMIQVTAQTDQSGTIAPVTAANVQNVGLNQGAGGFAGGPDAFMAAAGPAISVAFPEVAPFIAAYNSASAANKGQYGAMIMNGLGAAGIYAAQNPDSQIGQMVNGAIDAVKSSLPQSVQDTLNTPATPSSTSAPTTSTTNAPSTPQVGDTNGLGNTNYSVAPTSSTGTGLNVSQGTGTNLFDTSGVNPNTGLTNGIGLQAPGSPSLTNMAGQSIGQGLTTSTNTPGGTNTLTGQPLGTALNNLPGGTTATPGVIGATGTTPVGTGGLPVNTATGATLGTALNNVNTGVTTPSTLITDSTGKVVGSTTGTPATGLTTAQAAALGIPAAASVIGTALTNKAISNAAGTQAAAGQNAQNLIQGLYTQQGQIQAPYQQLGNQAVNTLGSLGSGTYNTLNPDGTVASTGTGSGYLTNQFNNTDLNAQLAPNYAFQLQQGLGQAQNAANVGGGLLSGNTLQGLNTYAQNYAQGAYQNAFNNYQTQRQNIYSNLSNQAGIGQTANQQLSSLGGQLANTYGNVTTGLAATQAGATTAQAVNNANLLSNLANTATVAALA